MPRGDRTGPNGIMVVVKVSAEDSDMVVDSNIQLIPIMQFLNIQQRTKQNILKQKWMH
jgi:hypothetical protein